MNCGCEIGPGEIVCNDCGDNIFNNYSKVDKSNDLEVTNACSNNIDENYDESNDKIYTIICVLFICLAIGYGITVLKKTAANEKILDGNLNNNYSEEVKSESEKVTPSVSIEKSATSDSNQYNNVPSVSVQQPKLKIENDKITNNEANSNEINNKVEPTSQNEVSNDYTSYYLGQDVYLRSSPGMDGNSNIICKVYKGDTIYDLGETPVKDVDNSGRERNWIKVRTSDGKIGYVSDRAINMTDKKPYER